MKAKLIYTPGFSEPYIPSTFKKPKDDQFLGSALEKLTEVACRICYDSMGLKMSRSSEGLHDHIQDAPNLSVYEHAWLTIMIPVETERYMMQLLACCNNRPGVRVLIHDDYLRITANVRSILEWEKWTRVNWTIEGTLRIGELAAKLGTTLLQAAKFDMPTALRTLKVGNTMFYVRPDELFDSEKPWSMWLYGSRGFTHEMVRHRFNMSQRSTRFVDEYLDHWSIEAEIACVGEYVYHPLIKKYLADPNVSQDKKNTLEMKLLDAQASDHQAYKYATDTLEEYTGNRKQARGAARGSLGNALASEMIYTASVADWHGIFAQRATDLADAEIREVMIDALKSSGTKLYGFKPATDGLGQIAGRL